MPALFSAKPHISMFFYELWHCFCNFAVFSSNNTSLREEDTVVQGLIFTAQTKFFKNPF